MDKQAINNHTRALLAQGKVDEALAALSAYTKGHDQRLENDLLLQTAALNSLKRDHRMGIVTDDHAARTRARIRLAITQLLDDAPEHGNDVGGGNPAGGITPRVVSPPTISNNGHRKILFLSASPDGQSRLRVDKEYRQIKDSLAATSQRDGFTLISEPAVTIATITRTLQAQKPEIVHFSGHGMGEPGLVVEGKDGKSVLFPTPGLDRLFRLFKETVQCVVLNACYSAEQAATISKHGIYVLGMNKAISDNAAIDFSTGFYVSLGEGGDYEFSYGMAMVDNSANLHDAATPEIWLDGQKLDL